MTLLTLEYLLALSIFFGIPRVNKLQDYLGYLQIQFYIITGMRSLFPQQCFELLLFLSQYGPYTPRYREVYL